MFAINNYENEIIDNDILIDTVFSYINQIKQQENHLNDSVIKPLMILGPSGVGKDTMINRLKAKYPNIIYKLPSYTTRPMRKGEIEGVDYFFVTKEQFQLMRDEGCLFGIQEYNNNFYASNKNKLKELMANKNKIIILNYNIETANSVKDELDFNYVAIYPPSEEELQNRLIKRGTKAEEIKNRMEKSKIEINLIQEADYIDFRLLNDDEDKAFNNLEKHLKELYPFLK
jgi:guanylate kinase